MTAFVPYDEMGETRNYCLALKPRHSGKETLKGWVHSRGFLAELEGRRAATAAVGVRVQEQGEIRTLHLEALTEEQATAVTERVKAIAEEEEIFATPLTDCIDLRPGPMSKGPLGTMMVTESRPGGALARFAKRPIRVATMFGDDLGDADVWEHFGALEMAGELDAVCRVGVIHPGRPVPVIAENADVRLTSVNEVGEFLWELTG